MPTDITDARLGTLVWEGELNCWTHDDFPLTPRGTIHLSVSPRSDADLTRPALRRHAETVCQTIEWVRRHEPELRLAVAMRSLDGYNDHWRNDAVDPDPIDAAEFAERIHLTSLDVVCDGEVTLYFDDGDDEMFDGHAIIAHLNRDRRLHGEPYLGE